MTTYHSLERICERTGCNKKSAPRIIENAFYRGARSSSFTGKEKEYMQNLIKDPEQYECVYYNNAVFIFAFPGICVTVLNAPKWFGKKKQYTNKKVGIRNAQRLYSYNMIEEDFYDEAC